MEKRGRLPSRHAGGLERGLGPHHPVVRQGVGGTVENAIGLGPKGGPRLEILGFELWIVTWEFRNLRLFGEDRRTGRSVVDAEERGGVALPGVQHLEAGGRGGGAAQVGQRLHEARAGRASKTQRVGPPGAERGQDKPHGQEPENGGQQTEIQGAAGERHQTRAGAGQRIAWNRRGRGGRSRQLRLVGGWRRRWCGAGRHRRREQRPVPRFGSPGRSDGHRHGLGLHGLVGTAARVEIGITHRAERVGAGLGGDEHRVLGERGVEEPALSRGALGLRLQDLEILRDLARRESVDVGPVAGAAEFERPRDRFADGHGGGHDLRDEGELADGAAEIRGRPVGQGLDGERRLVAGDGVLHHVGRGEGI